MSRFDSNGTKQLSSIEDTELRNRVWALMATAEFPTLSARVRIEAESSTWSRGRLRDLLAQTVRRLAGDHVSVLHNPDLLTLLDEDG